MSSASILPYSFGPCKTILLIEYLFAAIDKSSANVSEVESLIKAGT